MEDPHSQSETHQTQVNVPDHVKRTASRLFETTRKALIKRDGGCFICGGVKELEAHHHPVEWSFAMMVDFSPASRIRKDFPLFDWAAFDSAGDNPYSFVDNMLHNGLLLCKTHHIKVNQGIHAMPYPLWVAQRYGREGYKFSDIETIHHQRST